MENPATWGEAERVIERVLGEWYEMLELPPQERPIGLSLNCQITGALRDAGLLKGREETVIRPVDEAEDVW